MPHNINDGTPAMDVDGEAPASGFFVTFSAFEG